MKSVNFLLKNPEKSLVINMSLNYTSFGLPDSPLR